MKPLRHHFLRIDARSLGLFRIAFALVLIFDLFARWAHITAFYSNEGVLPNHNHLFNLKGQGTLVWSALHAFSSPGEAKFGFAVILLFYVCFLLGWKTRAFHVLSLVSLVSLAARNTLAEGFGDHLAIAIAFFTVFLPLGSRFSIDAIVKGMREAQEKTARDLNDRRGIPSEDVVQAARMPGWSPTSIAAFGVLVQIALVLLTLALTQSGAWRDGTALSKALHVQMFASELGFDVRGSGLLGPLTQLVYWSQWAVPILLFVPVFRGPTRAVAAVLLVVHGITYGVLFNFGLFGFTIAATAALVISSESWESWAKKHDAKRVRTVVYDADCGICFWLCKLLARLDTRRHLVFQGNDSIGDGLLGFDEKARRVGPYRAAESSEANLPPGLTPELLDKTVVAVAPDGTFTTRGGAVADVLVALPGFSLVGRALKLPGLSQLTSFAYDVFAPRRTGFSVLVGLTACGLTFPPDEEGDAPAYPAVPPSKAARFAATSALRELAALVFFASVLATTTHNNKLGFEFPTNPLLSKISWWSRTLGTWDVLTPEPPAEQGTMIVDAITRSERSIDPLTGELPVKSFERPFRLGAMWQNYLRRIQLDEKKAYQNAFKTYLGKRGPKWDAELPDDKITGVDAYWITGSTHPTDQPIVERRLFRHGRGGATFAQPSPATRPRDPGPLTLPRRPELERSPGDDRPDEPQPPPAPNPDNQRQDETQETP